jgi:uncharacterized membrane protein
MMKIPGWWPAEARTRRKVSPNPVYGFRVRQTLDDPAVWYPVNAYAAKGLLCVGLLTAAASVLLYLVPGVDVAVYASAVAAVFAAALGVSLVLSFRYLYAVAARGGPGGGA